MASCESKRIEENNTTIWHLDHSMRRLCGRVKSCVSIAFILLYVQFIDQLFYPIFVEMCEKLCGLSVSLMCNVFFVWVC